MNEQHCINNINIHMNLGLISDELNLTFQTDIADFIFGSKYDRFVEIASRIHQNKYDYTKVELTNDIEKVIIQCPKHGEFQITPYEHINLYGCFLCEDANEEEKILRKKDHFIEKAKIYHNDKYDYSEVNYINHYVPINIKCEIHGIFSQAPMAHLKTRGCCKCTKKKTIDAFRKRFGKTTPEFIKEAIKIHKDKYIYSEVNYINNVTRVKILCKYHGEFEQMPLVHLKGSGCKKCSIITASKKMRGTSEIFYSKAYQRHGDRYDYRLVDYTGHYNKVIIICKEHGPFRQKPTEHIKGRGCQRCGYIRMTTGKVQPIEKFIDRAKLVHGNIYEYTNMNYTNRNSLITVKCPSHGNFQITARWHLAGYGCKLCKLAKNERYISPETVLINTNNFIEKANVKHDNKYDYSLTQYKNTTTKMKIICKEHGEFEQDAKKHLEGHGCRDCGFVTAAINRAINRKRNRDEKLDVAELENNNDFSGVLLAEYENLFKHEPEPNKKIKNETENHEHYCSI